MGRLTPSPSLLDEAFAHQRPVQDLAGRHRPVGVQHLEMADDLAGAPTGSASTELEGGLEDVVRRGMRGGPGPV